MEFRKFTFKEPGYRYNEATCDSLVRAFGIKTEEYKNMTPEEQKEFYHWRFLEECKVELMCVIMKKLKSVNAYYRDSYQEQDMLMMITCESLPYELYPNVIEWVNDDPMSEISYNGLSIKAMVDQMNFPDFESYHRVVPTLTREKYEEQKARCYLRIFAYMATYAKNGSKNPESVLCDAACAFRRI